MHKANLLRKDEQLFMFREVEPELLQLTVLNSREGKR
jgi:hypothetical protein